MRHVAQPGRGRATGETDPVVVVVGGVVAGPAAATGLAERCVRVVLVEPEADLGGRVRVGDLGDGWTTSRGFHAFYRQYFSLRSLLRRADPGLDGLVPIRDYPRVLAANRLLADRGVRRHDLWSVPVQARNRVSPPLHRFLDRVG